VAQDLLTELGTIVKFTDYLEAVGIGMFGNVNLCVLRLTKMKAQNHDGQRRRWCQFFPALQQKSVNQNVIQGFSS
jgi:hypothetical protein